MNLSKLQGQIPANVFAELPSVLERFQINTTARLAHFLSQCDHESGGFKTTVENLNYSASRLVAIFPRYFDEITAKQYERQPERIANRVYANRMGNGNEASGDGFRYCGRGYIQLTGRDNYAQFDKMVVEDIMTQPRLVATKYPLFSAAWWWNQNRVNSLCTNDPASVVAVTRRVNGGQNGLAHRQELFAKYIDLLT